MYNVHPFSSSQPHTDGTLDDSCIPIHFFINRGCQNGEFPGCYANIFMMNVYSILYIYIIFIVLHIIRIKNIFTEFIYYF